MNQLRPLIGPVPADRSGFVGRMRFHQGWWRAFILNVPPGPRPNSDHEIVCNVIGDRQAERQNFLTDRVANVVDVVLAARDGNSAGIVDERRLRSNLLSSQPLAFNFFAHLVDDLPLASRVLERLFAISGAQVVAIHFEYAPRKPAGDNSAFDAAIEYTRNGRRGLVGVECKYTDTFSPTEYRRPEYEELYRNSSIFRESYETLTSGRYNQLFRNQLVGEGLRQRGDFDEVHVRLFCAPGDDQAQTTGKTFASMIGASSMASFDVTTYEDFITAVQRQELSWADREWTMQLWARYCALHLSEQAYRKD